MVSKLKNISLRKLYIICVAVTLAALIGVFLLVMNGSRQVAPLYELTVKGLSADTPQEAQMICRADSSYYRSVIEPYSDCCWVWTGDERLYVVRTAALNVDPQTDKSTGFTYVRFKDMHGVRHSGYIIDPTVEANEIARVKITNAEDFNIDNVSMSIRDSIRKNVLKYENAVYVWEKGQDFVYVLKEDAVTKVEDNICSFTDDGDTLHVGFMLDVRI